MITVITYKVNHFTIPGSDPKFISQLGADQLRTAFLKIVDRLKRRLDEVNVDATVFHNHDPKTGNPIIRYPLVLYTHKNEEFYITGLNEGALALKSLMDMLNYPVKMSRELVLTFELHNSTESELINTRTKNYYQITDWLPFEKEVYMESESLPAGKLIKLFETKLTKHIVNDLGKYLEIDLSKTKVEIISFPISSLPYISFSHKRKFKPFSFFFSTNADMPDFLCLGYEKAIGFGRLEKLNA